MLTKDRHWAALDGLLCEVTKFTPAAKLEHGRVVSSDRSLPYAVINIKCREGGVTLPPDACGAVFNKLDFTHLWAAFVDRGLAENEKVFVVWSKEKLHPAFMLVSAFMPRLAVLIFKNDGYKLISDNNYRPELRGTARWEETKPVAEWTPDIW